MAAALDSYRQALALDPTHVRAAGSGAYVLEVRGELAEALRWNVHLLEAQRDLHYQEIQTADTLVPLPEGSTVVAVVSGGNQDLGRLADWITNGLPSG